MRLKLANIQRYKRRKRRATGLHRYNFIYAPKVQFYLRSKSVLKIWNEKKEQFFPRPRNVPQYTKMNFAQKGASLMGEKKKGM